MMGKICDLCATLDTTRIVSGAVGADLHWQVGSVLTLEVVTGVAGLLDVAGVAV